MATINGLDLRLPYQKPSGPCKRFPGGKHRDPTKSHRKSTSRRALADAGTHNTLPGAKDKSRMISTMQASKIFVRILLNRLNGHLEQGLLPESQCGFRRHRRTTDMIFAARQLQERCQGMRTRLYTTFVDLTKAFDTVNRDGLWKVMQKFGCPEWFTHMVRQLHDGMTARVTDNGTASEEFPLTTE
ncbi:unnamed protein product [Schistocephalus solidus]|uniref:Reverse transcriptase domain-containing protein n=1 Tax=Schistocephalus solidus TaxID=70667 RepID=A0A183SRZ5_SCHSO|nr:unnamed protein product [Schistocephalus solidus]